MLNKNISLDTLKVLLAFMIVAIHAKFFTDISSLGACLTGNGIAYI